MSLLSKPKLKKKRRSHIIFYYKKVEHGPILLFSGFPYHPARPTVTHLADVGSISTCCPNLAVIRQPGRVRRVEIAVRVGTTAAIDRDASDRGELRSVEDIAGKAGTPVGTGLVTEVGGRLVGTGGGAGGDTRRVLAVGRAGDRTADRGTSPPVGRQFDVCNHPDSNFKRGEVPGMVAWQIRTKLVNTSHFWVPWQTSKTQLS